MLDLTQEPWNIGVGGTCVLAWHHRLEPRHILPKYSIFVSQGTRWADGYAGSAEAAAGVAHEQIMVYAHPASVFIVKVGKHFDSPQFLAGTHAPAALDASLRIADEEGVSVILRFSAFNAMQPAVSDAQILRQGLQFTVRIFETGSWQSRRRRIE